MRYSFLTVLAPLLLGTSLALHIDNAGGLVARGSKIRPFQGNPLRNTNGGGIVKREPSVIKGLLQIRQSCPSGYGVCANNKCCPLGGDCCSRGCCNSGEFCYSSGCCDRSETGCEQVTCCPSGTHCCKGGTCCLSSEYCVTGGCCPNGELCVGGGGVGGGDSGGGGGDDPTTAPTTRATHTSTHRTTSTSTSTSEFSITRTSTSSSSTQSLNARPTASAGQVSVTYEIDDSRITWSSGWTTVTTSNCTIKSRRTTVAMESFTIIVASASRIYLNIDVVSVVYDVYVNNVLAPVDFDHFLDTESCAYTPLTVIGSTTNINVTVVVVGLPTNGRKRQNSNDWSFQLNEILTFDSNGNSDPNSTSGLPSDSTSNAGHAAARITLFQIIAAVLLVAFGSFW